MILDDVRAYLVALGVVEGSSGWKCYAGVMPDDQDQCVGLFFGGGLPADTLGRENERGYFMLRVRASRWRVDAAHARWKVLFDALQDAQRGLLSPDPLASVTYVQAVATAPNQFNDANGRPNLTTNFKYLRDRE